MTTKLEDDGICKECDKAIRRYLNRTEKKWLKKHKKGDLSVETLIRGVVLDTLILVANEIPSDKCERSSIE